MKVLIGYDGSIHADAAINDLRRAGLPRQAEAIVLSSIEWPTLQALRSWGMVETDFSPEWIERVRAAEGIAESGAARLRKLFPDWTVEIEPSASNPADAILEKAAVWPADLIVVGTHGHSALGRALVGSVSMRLIREARCNVRVGRQSHREGPIHVLIGTDGSVEADAILDRVCHRTWPVFTEFRVITVQEILVPVNAERILIGEQEYDQINKDEHIRSERVATLAVQRLRGSGLFASAQLIEGSPKESLVEEAQTWGADTVFVGARGLRRLEGFLLGSVSSGVVAHAPCSVEVVHS